LKTDLKDILANCYADSKYMAKVIFDDQFEAPFSSLHDQMFDVLDSPANKIVIAAPRGIGKTTIARMLASKAILFRDKRFVVYVSNSATSAEMQTENIKVELLANKNVRKIFGNVKHSAYDTVDEQFSKKSWVANGHTMVLPRGSGQQIRGLNWIRYRPDLFIIDDLEDTDTLNNEEIRKKRKQWFFGDLMKAVPRLHKNWKIIYIDTVKHEDSLIQELIDADDWTSIRLSICDDKYQTLADDFMPQEELDQELKQHRDRKLMDVFAMEFMSIPVSRETASFKSEYFKYYNETDKKFTDRRQMIENVVIVDPAKTANMNNAESGIVVWGVDVETNALYLREALGEHLHPDELYTRTFELATRYRARVIGIEVTGLNEFITYPFKNEMIRQGLNFEILELKARSGKGEFSGVGGGKKGRIASLIPFYRQGLVYHNEVGIAGYESQLISFPKSKKWDIMDAAAYVVEILEMGLRYFIPRDFIEDDYDIEKEYDVLEDEYQEPAIDDWRIEA
tara:strand:- start:10912 stop:12438 length:1527 start_codon:yes stop_codon:yes gene_type:complete